MSEEIIKVLEYLGEKLGVAVDWTSENIVPYAEELFKRLTTLEIIRASIGIFIGIIFIITAIVLFAKLIKKFIEAHKSNKDNILWDVYNRSIEPTNFGFIVSIIAVISAVAGIIIFGANLTNLIEWIIIPEVEFVKEIAYLVGTTV